MKLLIVSLLLVAAVAVFVDGASIDPAQVEAEESVQGDERFRRSSKYCPFPPGHIPVIVDRYNREPTCNQKCSANGFRGGNCYDGYCACYY